jgi:lipopolysaccharide assembly outer membrane protein LptD (OstA)
MNERTQRFLLLVAALALTLGVGVALRRARLGGILSLTPAIAPRPIASVAVRFRDVTVTGYESGKEAWVVAAPVIETDQDRRTMRFTGGLKATLLEQGKPGAYLTSPSATFTDQSKLDFTGGLEATLLQNGQPRATLSAPTASFDIKTRSFLAAGSILIKVKPPAKPVRGELPLSLGTLTITCSQLSYSVGTKQVICSGKVKIVTEKGDEVFGRDLTLNIETRDFILTDFQGIIHAPKDENEIL